MFLVEIKSMKIGYNLPVRRHNREKHNILHQTYISEASRLNLLKKPK